MGIGKIFSDAIKLLVMGVGVSDAGTIPRRLDLSKVASGGGWRVRNCSPSTVEFKGKEAIHVAAQQEDAWAIYENLDLFAGKVDLAIAAIRQHVGLIIRARGESEREIVAFEVSPDAEKQRLTLTVRFKGQSAAVKVSPQLIDEWLAVRVVLAREFTAIFLNNSNTPSLKVPAQPPDATGGKIGLWVAPQSQALVADLKYIQSRKREFE